MTQVWKHRIDDPKNQTFLVIIKYGDMANFALVLKENLFEDFMINNFAKLIVENEMEDNDFQVIDGDPISPYGLQDYLL